MTTSTTAVWAKAAPAPSRWTAQVVGTARIERTLPFRLSLDETLDCGEDTGTPVSEDYVGQDALQVHRRTQAGRHQTVETLTAPHEPQNPHPVLSPLGAGERVPVGRVGGMCKVHGPNAH